jgi:hypothetical protein
MTGCRGIGLWSPLHHDKARPLQVSDQPVRGDPGHHAVRVVDPLPAVIAECKRQRLGEFIVRRGAKGWSVRHGAFYRGLTERSKNKADLIHRRVGAQPQRRRIRSVVGLRRCPSYAPTMRATGPIRVNRAAVLTLGATIVAERLGYLPDTALTLGRFVAGSSTRAKVRSLGIAAPDQISS